MNGRHLFRWSKHAVLATSIALSACGTEVEPPPSPPAVAEPEYDGLSREEIELQAEPMTPAEAERLGIVDTMIRIESPVGEDTLLVGGVLLP